MNLYIGLYGCHGVIRFDVKFWEIKIRQNFTFFTVAWLILIGKGRRAQKRSGNESKAHPARVQEVITSVTTPHLDGVSVHGKHDFKFVWHFAGTYLYSWLWRGTLKVQCLTLELNTAIRTGFEPRPLDLQFSALTVQPSLLQGRMGWVRLLPYVLRKLVKVTSHGLCRGLQFRVVIKKRRAHCCVTCQGIKGLKVIKSN